MLSAVTHAFSTAGTGGFSGWKNYDHKIVAEPMDNGEFDRMIRFEEGEDKYYYCFKDEGCHIIYHRFLPEDYADFGFKPDKKIRNRGNTNENRNI